MYPLGTQCCTKITIIQDPEFGSKKQHTDIEELHTDKCNFMDTVIKYSLLVKKLLHVNIMSKA